jgi:DNA-binding GntR family transcriptional regulator
MRRAKAKVEGLRPVGRGESLTEKVYQELRISLMCGRFMPGQRLVHRLIADQLKVSPTPVREALLRLASEGALDFDNRGVVVVPRLLRERYAEILALRVELEGRAAAKAAARATPSVVQSMSAINDRMAKAKRAGDFETVMTQNERFHFTMIELAGMPVLKRLVESLWMQCGPTVRLLYENPVEPSGLHPHLALLAALKNNDAKAARAALTDDLVTFGKHILARLEHGAQKV